MKTVRLGSTSSTLLTTSKKRGFSRNLVSLFVWIFVAVFARTVAGGAVWGGPEEKQELEPAYIPTFFSSGGKRFCLDAAIRQRRAVLYWEPVCWHRLPQLTLTPQERVEGTGMEGLWISQFSPTFSNFSESLFVWDSPRATWGRGWLELILWEGRLSRKLWSANRSSWLITRSLNELNWYFWLIILLIYLKMAFCICFAKCSDFCALHLSRCSLRLSCPLLNRCFRSNHKWLTWHWCWSDWKFKRMIQ